MAIVNSLEFVYRSRTYFALIRKRTIDEVEYIHVKIMNSLLVGIWAGHETIIKKNGKYSLENEVADTELLALKKAIIGAISQMEEAPGDPKTVMPAHGSALEES